MVFSSRPPLSAGIPSGKPGDDYSAFEECNFVIDEVARKADTYKRKARWSSFLLTTTTAMVPVTLIVAEQFSPGSFASFISGRLAPGILAALAAILGRWILFEHPTSAGPSTATGSESLKLNDSDTAKGWGNTLRMTATVSWHKCSRQGEFNSIRSGPYWYRSARNWRKTGKFPEPRERRRARSHPGHIAAAIALATPTPLLLSNRRSRPDGR